MPGQKAKAGDDPVHLQRGEKIQLKAARQRQLVLFSPGILAGLIWVRSASNSIVSLPYGGISQS